MMSLLKFSDIARFFEELELKLIASLRRNLRGHKDWEKSEGFRWTAWQAQKLRNLNSFRRENTKILGEYTEQIDADTRRLIEEQFHEGELLADEAVGADGIPDSHFFGVNNDKMHNLMNNITQLEKDASSAALRMVDDVYRQTLNKVQLEMATGSVTLPQAIDDAVSDFLAKGINCIVYKDGKRVNVADYVRMALRTTSTRASLQGMSKRWSELGYDTVLVSQYSMCSETCLPWQGQVYIDDVFTEWNGERAGDRGRSNYCGKWFTLLSVAIRAGLFHPNCRHTLTLYRDGVTKIPEPIDGEKIKKQRQLEQKQRALEKKVRKFKRLEAGTQSPEIAAAYRKELRQAQHELKVFVDEHNDVLRRDYSREKVYGEHKPITNYSKVTELFNEYEMPDDAIITPQRIYDDLKTSKTGLSTITVLENLPQPIKLDYVTYAPDLYGEQRGDEIIIYVRSCKDVKRAACSVIHECTHYRYGISNCQWAESVCIAQEIKHRRRREYLTFDEKRTIIKAVKEAYGNLSWRKGGTRFGRHL